MKIITLGREYGAGGHSIGKRVAEELGIEFYDRDIIRETAKASGIDAEQIEREEEQMSRSDAFFRAITPISFDYKDTIYDYQRRVILDIAKKGPCVILGRCANVILQNMGIDCLNVFLYADEEHRAVRVGEILGTNNISEILREMKKTDHARRAYYAHYTGKAWNECNNYHLSLDSGVLGYDTCVKLICAAAKD